MYVGACHLYMCVWKPEANVCVCVCVKETERRRDRVCKDSGKLEEAVRYPRSGVTDSCDPTNVSAEN